MPNAVINNQALANNPANQSLSQKPMNNFFNTAPTQRSFNFKPIDGFSKQANGALAHIINMKNTRMQESYDNNRQENAWKLIAHLSEQKKAQDLAQQQSMNSLVSFMKERNNLLKLKQQDQKARLSLINDDSFSSLAPKGFDKLSEEEQNAFKKHYYETGEMLNVDEKDGQFYGKNYSLAQEPNNINLENNASLQNNQSLNAQALQGLNIEQKAKDKEGRTFYKIDGEWIDETTLKAYLSEQGLI